MQTGSATLDRRILRDVSYEKYNNLITPTLVHYDVPGTLCAIFTARQKDMTPDKIIACALKAAGAKPLLMENKKVDLSEFVKGKSVDDVYCTLVPDSDALIPDNASKLNRTILRKFQTDMAGLDRWTTPQTASFLVIQSNSYTVHKRAIIEHTLGRLDVERRIAVHYFLIKDMWDYDSGITSITRSLNESKDRLKLFEKLGGPPKIIAKEKELLRNKAYIRMALIKNKDWLERFFAS